MFTISTEKLPIKIWAKETELAGYEDAIAQAKNLANLPIAHKWVCLMPDFHVGFGMPIGGVLAAKGGVVPNAVGVDIGCGMIAAQTSLIADQLSKELLQRIRIAVHRKVPVGMAHHKEKQHSLFLEKAQTTDIMEDPVISTQLESAMYQIGSLGGGNHFIEIQKDEDSQVWIMIHSGSRNLGKRVCDYYHKVAKQYMEERNITVPDTDLSFLPEDTKEFSMYLNAMRFCMQFAEQSRELMFQNVKKTFAEYNVGFDELQKFDTHHNFAEKEKHFGEELYIHRKGAVRAEGLVTIPGSMGTASYICEGLKPEESFVTCSHGAGRRLGRKQANALITHEQAVEAMKGVVFGIKNGDYDEMPMAYKDIDTVIADQADLVTPKYRLLPLAVIKG